MVSVGLNHMSILINQSATYAKRIEMPTCCISPLETTSSVTMTTLRGQSGNWSFDRGDHQDRMLLLVLPKLLLDGSRV